MPRLFAALSIPHATRIDLAMLAGGVPGARWVPQENFHITLRFMGEVTNRVADDLDSVLAGLSAAPFDLALKGIGQFGNGKPRSIWAGVEPNTALNTLAAKVERACQRIGLEPDTRNFAPHVTLARLRNSPPHKVQEFVENHALYRSAPFEVTSFALYSSELTGEGSIYHMEATYPLTRAAA